MTPIFTASNEMMEQLLGKKQNVANGVNPRGQCNRIDSHDPDARRARPVMQPKPCAPRLGVQRQ